MMAVHTLPILPHQCRMARGAARLSRRELAKMSGVSERTIANFEGCGPHKITTPNAAAVRSALEAMHVRFTDVGVDLSLSEESR
jgi:transcriptional regulator with XRE-family HTH domain